MEQVSQTKFRRFGLMLRGLRESRGLSQDQLGQRVGYSGRAVGEWESGRNFIRDPDAFRALADFFDPGCREKIEIKLLHAAGFLRDCALRESPPEHLTIEQLFGMIPVEWTDRLAEVVAERVASKLIAALREERSLFAARSERVEELFLQAMRSQQEITRLVAELLRALQPRVAEAPAREPQQPD
jgi:transcriptional regulator with XRE-family HTH domain